MIELQRLGRYLKSQPDHCIRFGIQDNEAGSKSDTIYVDTDSDWAGDLTRRRSTSGMVVRLGKHLLRHSSTLQSVISLSSAEAEYYALTKGAAYSMGIRSMYADWGLKVNIVLRTDSSSGLSFSSRRGLGRMRHMSTRFLWLQEHVASKSVRIWKVKGTSNEADILTKPQSLDALLDVCRRLGQHCVRDLT